MTWTGNGAAQAISGIEVHWVAPPNCPGAEDLEARVRRLLGSEAAATPQKNRLVVAAVVVRVGGQYRMTLNVRQNADAGGVARAFESDSCESLTGAAAVMLALLARGEPRWDETGPSMSSGSPGTEPSSKSSSPGAPSSGPANPSAPTPRPTPNKAPSTAETPAPDHTPAARTVGPPTATPSPAANQTERGSANVDAEKRTAAVLGGPFFALDEGILPSWAYGVGLGAGVRLNRLEALLTAALWLPQSESGDASASAYVGHYERRTGELSTCYGWPLGRFELGPCVTLALEDVKATGKGPYVTSHSPETLWFTAGLGVRARWSPRPWTAIFVRPGVAFSTSRPSFEIDGVGPPLYQVPVAAVGINIGCEWIL